jgi:hypothetical protein
MGFFNDQLKIIKFLVVKGANIHVSHKTYQFLIKHGIIKN